MTDSNLGTSANDALDRLVSDALGGELASAQAHAYRLAYFLSRGATPTEFPPGFREALATNLPPSILEALRNVDPQPFRRIEVRLGLLADIARQLVTYPHHKVGHLEVIFSGPKMEADHVSMSLSAAIDAIANEVWNFGDEGDIGGATKVEIGSL